MRILAITNIYPSKEQPWLGTFIEQQISGLRAAGVEVEVLYFDRKKAGPQVYYRMGPRIANAMAEFHPDVIHVMYGGVMADKVTCRSWSVPVVVTFHGSDLLGENLSGLFRKLISHYGVRCSRRAARRASGVVVVARHLLKRLPFTSGSLSSNPQLSGFITPPANNSQPSILNPEKGLCHLGALRSQPSTPIVRVIPCGVDLNRFQPMDQGACRRKLGWSPGTFHILFPANTGDPVKRAWLAQAAAKDLQSQRVKAELHLLSGVPYAEVPLWINASDVLILTSLHEGSPMVVKEALGCNIPVVSVAVGDVAERIAGIEGCHLAAAEPHALAQKLLSVWGRKARINAGPALSAFSMRTVADQLRAFYGDVLDGGGPAMAPHRVAREPVETPIQ